MPASAVPILRIFRARANPGCEAALAAKFSATSIPLVRGQPGMMGLVAGGPTDDSPRDLVFITYWSSWETLKGFFGSDWRRSLLPPGYADLIEECSVEHYEIVDRSTAG
jgi:hypothetical protein